MYKYIYIYNHKIVNKFIYLRAFVFSLNLFCVKILKHINFKINEIYVKWIFIL